MDAAIARLMTPIADRYWFIRLFEILPGFVSWGLLALPILLSIFAPVLVAYFIIAFDLFWLMKAIGLAYRLIRGYRKLGSEQRINWRARLEWVEHPEEQLKAAEQKLSKLVENTPWLAKRWVIGRYSKADKARKVEYATQLAELKELRLLANKQSTDLAPSQLHHAVVLAVYNEGMDILEPSVKALADADYDTKKIMLVIAYEERGGEQTEKNVQDLIARYGHHFEWAAAIKHPDGIEGEVIGKGGNITFAGRELALEVERRGIDPEHVIVTTFDSDHRAGQQYFSYLSYAYATNPNRSRKSYQPIPMFFNNIWDAPAPMRVIAVNNSFWLLMETMRPRRLRNFAAHAQGLKALIETDFWSVSTIVEDGHQFWRSYFAFDGDHQVVPLFVPVYQDAVLAETYVKTLKAQYRQVRRWAWGASDVQYVVRESIKNPRIPFWSKVVWNFRLLDGHVSWATTSFIITFTAYLPLYLNPSYKTQILAHQLPYIVSYIQQFALIGMVILIVTSMVSMPPRPAHYKRHRNIWMVTQWVFQPVTAIVFGSLAALEAQTRLMIGRRLEFQVTDKSTRPNGRWSGGKWMSFRGRKAEPSEIEVELEGAK